MTRQMATDLAIAVRASDAADIVRRRLELTTIPQSLHGGLVRYLVDGIRPGGFLAAILENDLKDAVLRASSNENLVAIRDIVLFLANETPAPCWGSAAKVAKWITDRRNVNG